jgi:hypothetical protein
MILTLPAVTAMVGDADVLHAIREPDMAIAIWQRPVPDGIAAIALAGRATIMLRAAPEALFAPLANALAECGYPNGPGTSALCADIVQLALRFAAVMNCPRVDIRLEQVAGDACRKFHADYVTARLICTYAGPGTQWLDPAHAADCACENPLHIRSLGPGDVAMLKGRLWSETAAAIHRSPPIAGTGVVRLVLVINDASQQSVD